MPGRAAAVAAGGQLTTAVCALGRSLGLEVREQVRVGKRIWGATRCIDIVLTHLGDRRRLGLECKFQGTSGTAEEKIPTTLQDIAAWPIPGLVVFDGEGFSGHMRSFLLASGRAVQLEDLEAWLRLFFGLEIL
ncbi:MAG: PD-(D/E)XK nuclease superfamily protein [Deltaproteobacteria bacterium]